MRWCGKVILLVSLTLLDMAVVVRTTVTDYVTSAENQEMDTKPSDVILQRLQEREFIAELRESLIKQYELFSSLPQTNTVEELSPNVFEDYYLLQSVEASESKRQTKSALQNSKAQRLFSFRGSGYEVHSSGTIRVSAGSALQRCYRLTFDSPTLPLDSITATQLILYQLPAQSEHDEWRGTLQSVQVSKIVTSAEGRELKLPLSTKMLTFGKEGHQILELSAGDDSQEHAWIGDGSSNSKRKLELEITVHFSGQLGEVDYSSSPEGDYGFHEDGVSGGAGEAPRVDDGSSPESQALHLVPPGMRFSLNESLPDRLPRIVIMTDIDRRSQLREKRFVPSFNYCTTRSSLCCPRNITLNFRTDLGLDFVMFPKEVPFSYCAGHCPLSFGPNSPGPSYYQAIADVSPNVTPCCAPLETSDLNVVTRNGVVDFFNVRAVSCQCF